MFSRKDAFRDLQKAAAQHGQGRLLTAQEMCPSRLFVSLGVQGLGVKGLGFRKTPPP